MIIAVDFDGTCVEHRFPEIGPTVLGAFAWMKHWQEEGAKLILWTVRADGGEGGPFNAPKSDYLDAAVAFCRTKGIEFWAVNENPEQPEWSESPKIFAHIYVDDAAVGAPLIYPKNARPYLDWSKVGPTVLAAIKFAKPAVDEEEEE